MPYRILVFTWRKPSMSPIEFKEHYENVHLPLLTSLVRKEVFPLKHIRHYVTVGGGAIMRPGTADTSAGVPDSLSYDTVAELIFRDEEHQQKFVHAVLMESEETRKLVEEDEEKFLDRKRMTVLVVGDTAVTDTASI